MDILYARIREITRYAFRAGYSKLDKKIAQFELFGVDILIDKDFEPYLIEINSNPALTIDTKL